MTDDVSPSLRVKAYDQPSVFQPYRETAEAIAHAESLGIVAVEMEAAALYAFAEARGFDVVCVAHVTNTMATGGDDFEKGEADGAHDALEIVAAIIERLSGDQADAVTSHAAPPTSTPSGDS